VIVLVSSALLGYGLVVGLVYRGFMWSLCLFVKLPQRGFAGAIPYFFTDRIESYSDFQMRTSR
jgi:hypothetical protein